MYYFVKGILLILIFIMSSSIGISISKMYENRVKELKQFKNILNILKGKIKFTYEPLGEIFKQISRNSSNKIEEIFDDMVNKMMFEDVKDAWKDSIQEADISLKQEDKDILKDLGKTLGQTDVENQISNINLTENFLNMQIEKAEIDRQKNQKIYKTLGVIAGLIFVIILI